MATMKLSQSANVISNITALGSSEIISRCVAFVGLTYIARTLGPEGFGIIGFAFAMCSFFNLIVRAGFDDIGALEVSHRPQYAASIAFSAILIRIGMAIIAMTSMAIISFLIDKPGTVRFVLLLSALSFFSLALDISWVYRGLERNRPVGVALILGKLMYVILVILTVHGLEDVYRVPLAMFVSDMCAAILLLIHIRSFGRVKLVFHEGWNILKRSGFLFISCLLRTLILTFDVVLLGFLLGEREVGLYTAPYRICYLLYALACVIQISYLPGMARSLKNGIFHVSEFAGRSIELSAAVSALLVVGGIVLASPILSTIFGPEFIEGAMAFKLLVLSIGFIFLEGTIHNILVVSNHMRIETWIMITATVINIGLNFLLIPLFGLTGAATATVIAEGFILGCGFIAVNLIGFQINLIPAVRPLLAAFLMATCLWGLSLVIEEAWLILVILLPLGCILFIVFLTIVNGIPKDILDRFR
ncbi:flippase [Candidatus Scalindua japonica]|uniref:flippase n=1 Tax=Candidatus Scalindua japonica TaxID=1284222 RepID=UPI000BDEED99|nr:flippase [Candidatus Scalindua japonica]